MANDPFADLYASGAPGGGADPFADLYAPAVPGATPVTHYSTGRAVGGPDESQDKWTNAGYTATGKNLTRGVVAVNPQVYPLGTILKDRQTGEVYLAADKHGNADPRVVDIYQEPDNYTREKGSRTFDVIGRVDKVPGDAAGVQRLLSTFKAGVTDGKGPATGGGGGDPFADLYTSPSAAEARNVAGEDKAFLSAMDPSQMDQPLPGMVRVAKALPADAATWRADDPNVKPQDDKWTRFVSGPLSVMPVVVPEYLKLAAAGAMGATGQAVKGFAGLGETMAGKDNAFPESTERLKGAGRWILDRAREIKDWADTNVVAASPGTAGAAETIGGLGAFAGAALANPHLATAFFAAGSGEDLAEKTAAAGGTPDQVAEARMVGAGLGLLASEVPTGRLSKMLGGNVNPFVRNVAQGWTQVLDRPDVGKRILASGIEAMKSGIVGAASGAAYRGGMNAAENHYTGSEIPITQGMAAYAAMFGIPSALGGAVAHYIASGRAVPFSEFVDKYANPARARVVGDGSVPEGAVPSARAAGGAEQEFMQRAGMAPQPIVPVQRGIVPTQSFSMQDGGAPTYTGQQFVDRGGPAPIYTGGDAALQDQQQAPALPGPGEQLPASPQKVPPAGYGTLDEPQQAPAVPVEPRRRRFSTDFVSTGMTPVMEWLSSEMPIRRSTSGKAGGENDDMPGMKSLGGFYRMVYSKSGEPVDTVAQAAHEAGLIKEPSPAALFNAMESEVRSYRNARKSLQQQEQAQKLDIRQEKDFQNQVATQDPEKTPINVSSLKVGDMVTVDGEQMQVTGLDPHTWDVTLQDGKRFGARQVQDGKLIYVEDYVPANDAGSTEFAPEAGQIAPSIAANGEGNLFNNADLPFNLQGEVDLTPELQRAADARRAAEEAKAEQDRNQDSLKFSKARTEPVRGADVRGWLDNVTADWRVKPDVVVHESAGAIPDAALRSQVLAEGGGVEGFYNPLDGSVHMIADQMRGPDDVERLLRHEGFHWAVNGPMRGEYLTLLQDAARELPEDALRAVKRDYRNADGQTIIEEALAREAQRNPNSTIWQKFVAGIRRILRKIFGDKIGWNANDIRDFLRRANRTYERAGDGAAGSGGIRYSKRSPEGSGWMVQADKGSPYVQVELRHLDKIRVAAMPELIRLARMLGFGLPGLKKLPQARGYFLGVTGNGGKIVLDPRIFKDATSAAKTLAHEIGHGIDFLPDETLKRGNLGGHLMTLRDFLTQMYSVNPGGAAGLTPKERQQMRAAAAKTVGTRPGKNASDEDKKAYNDAVRDAYGKAVADYMEARGLTSETVIREELLNLSDWWKPFLENADKHPASYMKYRMSAKELYADAISVLLNSPADFKERAPTAWQMFFNYLDRKPDAKRALNALWDFLNKPEYERLAERRAGVLGMFKDGQELMDAKVAQRERTFTLTGFHDGLRTLLDTKYWPAIKRERQAAARGDAWAQNHLAEWFFDAHPLADNLVHKWLGAVQAKVRGPLMQDGLTEDDLGEFLLWDRIANERYEVTKEIADGTIITETGGRSELANPQGHTKETAIEQIRYLESILGPEKFTALRNHAKNFHDIFHDLTTQMRQEGMISDDVWNIIEQNREHYAAFVPLDYVDLNVSASIRKQIGTLKDIANPWVMTVLKGMATIRAIERNKAKSWAVNVLRQGFPAEIEPAKTVWDGKRQAPIEPRDPEKALLTVAEGGKAVSYYVPKDIAEMFQSADHQLLAAAVGPLDWIWHNVFYPTFITYNPVFQFIRNPIRDTRRTALNLPHGALPHEAVTMRVVNKKMVVDFVKRGIVSPEIAAALEDRAMSIPEGTWQASASGEDQFTMLAKRFGLVQHSADQSPRHFALRPVLRIGEMIKTAGIIREILPKLGTYRVLTEQLGWPGAEAGDFCRNHVGTPNWPKRGQMTRIANDIFPFSNICLKAWQADLRIMRRGFTGRSGITRKSPGSWWVRWFLTSGWLRVLQAAAAAGLFGAGLKAFYDRVGDYYKTNYDVLPLGESDGGTVDGKKSVFAIIPRDPTDRIMSGLLYTVSKAAFDTVMQNPQTSIGQKLTSVVTLGTSDMPGINPALKIAGGWMQFAQQGNAYDSFRGRNVLTNQQASAGGWNAIGPMLGWTVGQTGVNQFVQFAPGSNSWMEIVMGKIPVANGVVKVSEMGLRELVQQDVQSDASQRDDLALSMPKPVQQVVQEYNWLKSIGAERRTAIQEARYQRVQKFVSKLYKPAMQGMEQNPEARENLRDMLKSAVP